MLEMSGDVDVTVPPPEGNVQFVKAVVFVLASHLVAQLPAVGKETGASKIPYILVEVENALPMYLVKEKDAELTVAFLRNPGGNR